MPGLAKYFKDGSDEERDHAQMLVTFQVRLWCSNTSAIFRDDRVRVQMM